LFGAVIVKLPRRTFLHLAASAAALPLAPHVARAQAYPTRPVRIIVGVPGGGAPDIIARLIAQGLSERLGQQFFVENRPGAGTNIAIEAVVRAPPDGHTLLQFGPASAINATLYKKLSFKFTHDIAPVASIVRIPMVMLVNPSLPAKTVPEFIAYAKANPGKVSMASTGVGSPPHMTGEMFKMMADIDLVHVPYRGGTAVVADLIGGQVQVLFLGTETIEHIRSGKLRAIAVTTTTRLDSLPDIPTVGEFLPGFEASVWFGIGAPRDTPPDIIEKLNKEINAALADPKLRERLAELDGTVLAGSPTDFGKLIADETERWGNVIRALNIKAE
jgi:tripartite-type tricarboxylate transporter receptor subunit TctC